ncbi:MAG: ATP-binding protein [Rhodospirillaceae bacterium]|nr:ATP-binding protein [Rhodospirillaceae bacterium]MYG52454.1 ATP-binding protein [Rhodospirillaceae bacterium]MYH38820.1 ATP-binding protein [Rhodospirillaceae bacterium]MYK15980.1 ATP-binding protein [Rhodospirillaceae bacterium]
MMRKGGSNWVDGENFFDRHDDLDALEERVRDGTHTFLTAQRRMGKTSLVRELQRRLAETGEFETVFVDLEAAADPADAIAEIGVRNKSVRGAWDRIKATFANVLKDAGGRVEELSVADLKVKLRAGIDAGNWPERGDAIFAALAAGDRPVVLAIDELPILVNRLLKDETGRIAPEGKREADALLSWLRKNGQSCRGRVSMILSGSVSLEPLLEQAGLSAHANILSAYDLKPWSEETAVSCLAALAGSYGVDLPPETRREMCRRLRCCIPHHVQMFFDRMHDHLRRTGRQAASPEDVEWVYVREMLGVRGQIDLQHYESRLETVLGKAGYPVALEILTMAAVDGAIAGTAVDRYRRWFAARDARDAEGIPSVDHVLHVLQHDGYLEPGRGGYRFVSGLLEDWWRGRYGQNFTPVFGRRRNAPGTGR